MEMTITREDGVQEVTTTYRVSDGVMLRIGGLPYAAAEQFSCPYLAPALDILRSLDSDICDVSKKLTDQLFDAIRDMKERAASQHVLLSLKRNIFNSRDLSQELLRDISKYLSPETYNLLQHWHELRTTRRQHIDRTEAQLAQWTQVKRRDLQKLASTPDFHKGLLTSSPSFERALRQYLSSELDTMGKALRRTEQVLLSYLFRTTHKTSPFSRLTSVSLGLLESALEGSITPAIQGEQLHISVKPNLAVLARLRHAITRSVVNYPHLRLALMQGAAVQAKRIYYRRRTETLIKTNGPVHGLISDHSFGINMTPSLELIRHLLSANQSKSVAELRTILCSELDSSPAEADAYLHILVENGLLVATDLRPSVFDLSCWKRFALAMEDKGISPPSATPEKIIDLLHVGATEYAHADIERRQQILTELGPLIDTELKSIHDATSCPQPLFYEDASVSQDPIPLNKEAWHRTLAPMSQLHRAFSIFDPLLISKITLKTLFKKRYGSGSKCSNIFELSDFFHGAFYKTYAMNNSSLNRHNVFTRGTLNPLKVPEIARVFELRSALMDFVEEALQENPDAEEISLPHKLIEEIGRHASPPHSYLSNAFFVQHTKINGMDRLILNKIYGGSGSSYARFESLFFSKKNNYIKDIIRENLNQFPSDDIIFAEFQGGYETNLNHHTLVTDAEIVFPGEHGVGRSDLQINIDELVVQHHLDKDELQLYCPRLGKRVIPLYIGLFYPLALPDLQIFLLHFTSPISLPHDALSLSKNMNNFAHAPRLRYENIIIERASWTVPLSDIPTRNKLEGRFGFMLRLEEWRSGLGIPQRSFVRILMEAPQTRTSAQVSIKEVEFLENSPDRKPFYLDFHNPFNLSVFEKLTSGRIGKVTFVEALPGSQDEALTYNGQRHVAEYIFEITQD